jgi:hypothetical protein
MGTTYTTNQECFDYITGAAGSITVSTSTRPSSTQLGLFRDSAYAKIYKLAQTTTDSSGILKAIELEMVCLMWMAKDQGLLITVQLTEEQKADILSEYDQTPDNSSWQPNQDQLYTGY